MSLQFECKFKKLITGGWGIQDWMKGRRRKEGDALQAKKAEPQVALL
jgi:hypothetical protein